MAITVSGAGSAVGTDDVSSQNFSGFTTPAGCKGLLVGVATRGNITVSSITWDGVAMTAVNSTTGSSYLCHVLFLANPAIGNKTLAVTYSGAVRASVSFVPLVASGNLSVRASAQERDSTAPVAPQETFASSASDMGIAFLGTGVGGVDFSGTVNSDSGQTRLTTSGATGNRATSWADSEAGAGSTITMGFNDSNTVETPAWSLVAASIQEAATGSPSKRMMRGLGL